MKKIALPLLLLVTALAGCAETPPATSTNDRARALQQIDQRIAARSGGAVSSAKSTPASSPAPARAKATPVAAKRSQPVTPAKAVKREKIGERAGRSYTGAETGKDEIRLRLYD